MSCSFFKCRVSFICRSGKRAYVRGLLLLSLTVSLMGLGGCAGISETVSQLLPGTGDSVPAGETVPAQDEAAAVPKARVYMDELRGVLENFDGSYLRILSEGMSYVLNVERSSLECAHGMVKGDEISVIYEGRLEDVGAEGLKVLKVVDEVHKKAELSPQLFEGSLAELSPNTLTVVGDNGVTVRFPVAGSPQYYGEGVRSGAHIRVQYKGMLPEAAMSPPDVAAGGSEGAATAPGADEAGQTTGSENNAASVDSSDSEETETPAGSVVSADLVKVLWVSSEETYGAPAENLLSPSEGKEAKKNPPKSLRGQVKGTNGGVLTFSPNGADSVLSLSLSWIPCWFPSGISEGLGANVYYNGEWPAGEGGSFSPVAVYGDDVSSLSASKVSSSFVGIIVGSTMDTITLDTEDGARLICRPGNAPDSSDTGLETGCRVRIVFDATENPDSNIYHCIRIQPA